MGAASNALRVSLRDTYNSPRRHRAGLIDGLLRGLADFFAPVRSGPPRGGSPEEIESGAPGHEKEPLVVQRGAALKKNE
jgi:hypothetical protein